MILDNTVNQRLRFTVNRQKFLRAGGERLKIEQENGAADVTDSKIKKNKS